ncbi:MAG: hypothetical protein ACTSRA_14900 [Promethearchaeota archaeon]
MKIARYKSFKTQSDIDDVIRCLARENNSTGHQVIQKDARYQRREEKE